MPDHTSPPQSAEDPPPAVDQEVLEALLERFFWERIDRLTLCVYPYKKDRQPLQASGISIVVDAEPRTEGHQRAVHMSYHGCTVSAGVPDALANYMERERPFHRMLGLEPSDASEAGR